MTNNAINVPGKILFFGGYSVLENGHPSLSFAVVDENVKGVTATAKESGDNVLISNQFNLQKTIDILYKENVATTAFFLTSLYLKSKGFTKNFTIELTNSPMFGIEHKSGLGSSAAATVAVVKTLFAGNSMDLDSNSDIIHKLAQYSYAVYSGKTSSGFDIATCAAGHTIIYKRFAPASIELPSDFKNNDGILSKLLASVESKWEGLSIETPSIPGKYNILFFNIEGGKTSTISNVKAVMSWKEKNQQEYLSLMRNQRDYETEAINALLKGDDILVMLQTHKTREVHKKLQELIKASVNDFDPIEPEPLTKLIEFAETLPGVVAGRCPGAGGWDGLAFIIDKENFDEKNVSKFIQKGEEFNLKLTHIPLKILQ